jgi:hypothetical protein
VNKLIPSFLACCLLLAAGCATAQPAAQPDVPPAAPPIDTAIHWSSAGGATHVFLLPGTANQYRLFVTGGDLKVFYRTMVNSTTGVRKELLPKEPIQGGLREYEFTHKFSRMTIWMALEFMKGDARDGELTRVFYGGVGNVVLGDEYLKDKAEK